MLDLGDAFVMFLKALFVLSIIDGILLFFVWGATRRTEANDKLAEEYGRNISSRVEEADRFYGAPW